MLTRRAFLASASALPLASLLARAADALPPRKTAVSIEGRAFHVNGKPTYAGRTFEGRKVEGLLLNSRMVQATFDDENAESRKLWAYPDGSAYDAERNVREFVAAMPEYRRRGLIGFTVNLQGGSPQGYSKEQPWVNSASDFRTGALKPAHLARMERVLDSADALGMVPILGLFYFGQSPRFESEQAVVAAVDNATDWLVSKGYTNVIVEVANECNVGKHPDVIKPARAHELIERIQKRSAGKLRTPAGRLLVSTSYGGGTIPGENVAGVADFLLLHGNGVKEPARVTQMVERTRALKAYKGQPILFNEDDHFDFDKPANNMLAAVSAYAGWGFFDYRMKGEGFAEGYQSVPVDWGINSARKRGFFDLLAKVTGA
ncbi:MAG TPA: hypothetical protein VF796_28430 [Humisphaera sp.]